MYILMCARVSAHLLLDVLCECTCSCVGQWGSLNVGLSVELLATGDRVKVGLGLIPTECNRHNCPIRPDSVTAMVSSFLPKIQGCLFFLVFAQMLLFLFQQNTSD